MDLEIGSCCNLYTEFIFIQEADPEDIIDNRPKKTSMFVPVHIFLPLYLNHNW